MLGLRPERDRLEAAEVLDLVPHRRELRIDFPAEPRALDEPGVDAELVPPGAQETDVHHLRAGEPRRRRERSAHDRVLHRTLVPRDFDSEAPAQQAGIESELELLAPLRLQMRVAVCTGRERRLVAVPDTRIVEPRRVDRPWLLTRRAPCHPEPELIDEVDRPERLLVDR